MKTTLITAVLTLLATTAVALPEPNKVVAARATQSSGAAMSGACHVGYLAFWPEQCAGNCGSNAANCKSFTGDLNSVLTTLQPPGPLTIRKYESQDRATITKDTPMFICTTCDGKHDGKKI